MTRITRRRFIKGVGTAAALVPGIDLRAATIGAPAHPALTRINRRFLPAAEEVRAWHASKDSHGGPTLTGSLSWRHYLEMLETEWRKRGVTRGGSPRSFPTTRTGR
jgi:hypothetical protein